MTPSARLVVVALFGVAGVVALARTRPAPEPLPEVAPIAAPATTGEGDALRDGRCVDVNRASAVELALLPGVGPQLARALIEARTKAGRFAAPEALRAVRGVGPKTLAKIAPRLCFGPRSEQLEHVADAQAHLGGAARAVVGDDAGAHVEPDHPRARREVVEP
ncbi:MAG: helix-hairpin-helix domain-containing protein [Polyangiales bacterium]